MSHYLKNGEMKTCHLNVELCSSGSKTQLSMITRWFMLPNIPLRALQHPTYKNLKDFDVHSIMPKQNTEIESLAPYDTWSQLGPVEESDKQQENF